MVENVAPESAQHALVELFARTPVTVFTGAGVSTDSGIPDYRGRGTPPRTPMSISQFMHDEAYRRRFWAGARVGFERTAGVQPNASHRALAELEQRALINGVITQNVDGLHRAAGSESLVELHGNGSVIRCVSCDNRWSRAEVLAWFDELNPGFAARHANAEIAPDGDATVSKSEADRAEVPPCPVCGGLLRPDVVYFGETVPTGVFAESERLVQEATALLLVGTSLAVNTGMRLVHRAERRGIPLSIINRGPTTIDARPSVQVRIEGGTSETLTALVRSLSHSG